MKNCLSIILFLSWVLTTKAMSTTEIIQTPLICGGIDHSFSIEKHNLTETISLKDFINLFLKNDIESRKEIASLKITSDTGIAVYFQKLALIRELSYVSDIQCLIDNYQDGDVIKKYEIINKFGYESGFVLIREKRFIVIIISELRLV